ncbi:MAG: hypothetical protein V4574_10495 [Pseudomonadota bacterium]
MLGTLEAKLAAVVSDGVASRAHLAVGIAPSDPPAAGKGSVALALSSFVPETGFVPHMTSMTGPAAAPQSRRVLPLRFEAAIDFRLRPAQNGAPARAEARALLLEDMSAVAWLLADPEMANGIGFAVEGPDQGFRVLGFALASAAAPADLVDGCCTGRLVMRGDARVWPVGPAHPEDVIRTIDRVLAPLPLAFHVADAGVRPGASTSVTAALGPLKRLPQACNGVRGPIRLAVSVLADVPLAARGTIAAGVDGNEAGVRIVAAAAETVTENGAATGTAPPTVIPYQAPAGNPGPAGRLEYVAFHLATPDGGKGLYLGSAPIQLVPAP